MHCVVLIDLATYKQDVYGLIKFINMEKTMENIEAAIRQLSPNQLKEFREWYENFDNDLWDRKIEKDIDEGKLDSLSASAIAEHKAGRSRKL